MQANVEILTIIADFPNQIEGIVRSKRIGYMEAIEIWCDQNGKELTVGADYVKKSTTIKEKVKQEAEDLNLLPKSNRLPI